MAVAGVLVIRLRPLFILEEMKCHRSTEKAHWAIGMPQSLLQIIPAIRWRFILNDHLLQPKPKKRYEPDAKVTKAGNDIALELERDAPNEEFIIEKTIEMAALMYEQSNAKLNLTVSLARKLAHTMVTQDEFNRDYFTALASYITLGEQGKVVLHTKTETEVTLDDGSNESS